jgi:hypothetical protein
MHDAMPEPQQLATPVAHVRTSRRRRNLRDAQREPHRGTSHPASLVPPIAAPAELVA